MPDLPKISVLMPAYNAAAYIHKAIETILSQTYHNLELLIIDDCSTDNTLSVIRSFNDPRLKWYRNEKNLGYLKTCNKLFDLAEGDFIAFQDADDYSDPSRLELQMRQFEKNPALGVCGTNFTAVDEEGNILFCTHYACDHATIMEQMRHQQFSLIPNSFLFRREILHTIGKYHEFWDRIGAEDYYWAYLIMEKYTLINIKQPLYYYRYNTRGVTGDFSDNRRKLHTYKIFQRLIDQRTRTGTDDLEQNNVEELNAFIDVLDKPYQLDPTLFYRELARRDFYGGNKKRALKFMRKAIALQPLRLDNYRTYFYYLRSRSGTKF
ncbi:MAG: hypothetical protein KatS3mg031_1262 [Chitinophagales bacterium]|nr:MAG: hypothetical protein KatS3mg031_1262 [Chitinophagales bacterium]